LMETIEERLDWVWFLDFDLDKEIRDTGSQCVVQGQEEVRRRGIQGFL
jgi:hypothetical protein